MASRGTTTLVESAQPFEVTATEILSSLRSTLAAIVAAVPKGIRKASDLQEPLQIDGPLAWNIYRAATASEPLASALFLPTSGRMTRFFEAARKHGVAEELVAAAKKAFVDFEVLVDRYAGDRDTFESMIADLTDVDTSATDLRHKRLAFRSASHLWGRVAQTTLSTSIYHPNAEHPMLDAVSLRGHVGLRQIRQGNVVTTDFRWNREQPSAETARLMRIEPLVASSTRVDGQEVQVGLLDEFCSKPLPRLEVSRDTDGFIRVDLANPDVGNLGAMNCFFGHIARNYNSMPGDPGSDFSLSSVIGGLCEVFVRDVLMHKSVWEGSTPKIAVYRGPRGQNRASDYKPVDRLPVQEHVSLAGSGIECLHTPDVPRYVEMLGFALKRVGWNPDEFWSYRCRVEYPILSSMIRLTF